MGGTKKKSLASMEKSQDSQDAAGDQGSTSKGKKAKDSKSAPQQKKQLAFLPPKLADADLLKSLTPLKAITIHGASRALGVNASIAAGVIRDLEGKNLLKKEGGFSGHSIWAVAQKA
jgi:small subunit ribosomal protein S25e